MKVTTWAAGIIMVLMLALSAFEEVEAKGVKRGWASGGGGEDERQAGRRRLESEGESDEEAVEADEEEEEEEADGRRVVLRPREVGHERQINMRLPDVCIPAPPRGQGGWTDSQRASALMNLFGDSLTTTAGSMHKGILNGLQGSPLVKMFERQAVEMEVARCRRQFNLSQNVQLNRARQRFEHLLKTKMKASDEIVQEMWPLLRAYLNESWTAEFKEDLQDFEDYCQYAFDHPDEVCGNPMDGRGNRHGGGPGAGGLGGGGGLVA